MIVIINFADVVFAVVAQKRQHKTKRRRRRRRPNARTNERTNEPTNEGTNECTNTKPSNPRRLQREFRIHQHCQKKSEAPIRTRLSQTCAILASDFLGYVFYGKLLFLLVSGVFAFFSPVKETRLPHPFNESLCDLMSIVPRMDLAKRFFP